MNDLQEQLPGARVKDEDGPVDGLSGQVTLERLVDGHSVHIGIIHKPDDLVAKQLPVVLATQVRLSRLRTGHQQHHTTESEGRVMSVFNSEANSPSCVHDRGAGASPVQLQSLANALTKHVECRVGLNDLGHGLL
jgi:hypothetical protein